MRMQLIATNSCAVCSLFGLYGLVRGANEEVAVVVKIGAFRVQCYGKGYPEGGKEDNLNAYMIGPTSADPAPNRCVRWRI